MTVTGLTIGTGAVLAAGLKEQVYPDKGMAMAPVTNNVGRPHETLVLQWFEWLRRSGRIAANAV